MKVETDETGKLFHPCCRFLSNIMNGTTRVGFGFGRINHVNLAILRSIIAKPGGRVDLERCSYDKENICSDHLALSLLDLRHRFSEEYNMRTELPVVLPASVPEMYLGITYIENLVFAELVLLVIDTFRPNLRKFTMQMDDVGAACSFMQVINSLRYDCYFEIPFHPGKKEMCRVGLDIPKIDPSLVVKLKYLRRPFPPGFHSSKSGKVLIVP